MASLGAMPILLGMQCVLHYSLSPKLRPDNIWNRNKLGKNYNWQSDQVYYYSTFSCIDQSLYYKFKAPLSGRPKIDRY